MTSLITLLISLLGYGTPADFSHMTEAELQHEITVAEAAHSNGDQDGGWDDWDFPVHGEEGDTNPGQDTTNP